MTRFPRFRSAQPAPFRSAVVRELKTGSIFDHRHDPAGESRGLLLQFQPLLDPSISRCAHLFREIMSTVRMKDSQPLAGYPR